MKISGDGLANGAPAETDASQFRGRDVVSQAEAGFSAAVWVGAVSSEYCQIQLFNPASSGVVVLIDKIDLSPSADMRMYVGQYDSRLGSDVGNGKNLYSGKSDSLSELRSQTDVSILGAEVYSVYMNKYEFYTVAPMYPWILPENTGMIVGAGTVNISIRTSIFFREI